MIRTPSRYTCWIIFTLQKKERKSSLCWSFSTLCIDFCFNLLPTAQQTSYDPFGDFGNFGSSSSQSNSSSNLFSGGMASARSNSARSSPTFNKNPTSTTRPQQQQQQRPAATQQSRQQAPNYNVFVSNKQDSVFGKGTATPTGTGGWGKNTSRDLHLFIITVSFKGFHIIRSGRALIKIAIWYLTSSRLIWKMPFI